MALFSATIGLGITSLLTSCSAILGGNQSAPAAIMGVMAAGIAGITTGGETRLATVAVAVALTTLITGVSLYGLGAFRLAGLARFLPYPVAGGFLAGTGWLLVVGGIGTMAHRTFSFTGLPALFDPNTLILWLPGLILGAAILILLRAFATTSLCRRCSSPSSSGSTYRQAGGFVGLGAERRRLAAGAIPHGGIMAANQHG